jgi:hypothetical protein
MSQDPRKLRKLLSILSEHGVTKYKTKEVEVELFNPVTLGHKMYDPAISVANEGFSMDNYDKEPEVTNEVDETSVVATGQYTDDEMLFWSASP